MNTKINYEELFREHVAAIYRFAYYRLGNKAKAEDVTAEAFKRLLEKQDLKPELAKFWLFRVARNLIYDQTKAENVVDTIDETTTELVDEEADDFDATLLTQELEKLIRENLATLPSKTQEVIALKVWEEMTFAQIADVVAEKESTVKLRYYRGLEKLKEILADKPETRHLSLAMLAGSIAFMAKDAAFTPSATFVQQFLSTSLPIFMEATTTAASSSVAAGGITTAKAAIGIFVTTAVIAAGAGAALVMNNNAQKNSVANSTTSAIVSQASSNSSSSTTSVQGFKLLPQTTSDAVVLVKDETYLIDKCGITFKPFYDNSAVTIAPANMTFAAAQAAMKDSKHYGWSYGYELHEDEAVFTLTNTFFADKNNPVLHDDFSTMVVPNGAMSLVCYSNEDLTVKQLIQKKVAEFQTDGGTLTYTKVGDERVFGIHFVKYKEVYGNQGSTSDVFFANNGEYIVEVKIFNTTGDEYAQALSNLRSAVKAKLIEIKASNETLNADPYAKLGDTCKQAYTTAVMPGFKFDYDSCLWKIEAKLPSSFGKNGQGIETGTIKLTNASGTMFMDFATSYDGATSCSKQTYKLVKGKIGRYEGEKYLSPAQIYDILHVKGTMEFQNIATAHNVFSDPAVTFCSIGFLGVKDKNNTGVDLHMAYIGKKVAQADAIVETMSGVN
jgi:RNA polymerase sigma-70 factor (ECF subfamily)